MKLDSYVVELQSFETNLHRTISLNVALVKISKNISGGRVGDSFFLINFCNQYLMATRQRCPEDHNVEEEEKGVSEYSMLANNPRTKTTRIELRRERKKIIAGIGSGVE